jgi:hypothetical protein
MVMELLQLHPLHTPPYADETDWPSETERNERWSHLRFGHVKRYPSGHTSVIDAVPPLYLQPIKFELLPNPAACKAMLEFHNIGLGDGTNDAQTNAYLESHSRGCIAFGPSGTAKTRLVFARLSQLYVWRDSPFRWTRAFELARLALGNDSRDGPNSTPISELATFDGNVFIDDLDVLKLSPKYAEALYQIIDHRVSEELPIVITTVTTGDEFIERVAGRCSRHLRYLAEGIVGRLRQSCDCIDFGDGISPK